MDSVNNPIMKIGITLIFVVIVVIVYQVIKMFRENKE
jgi:hypothetical protein